MIAPANDAERIVYSSRRQAAQTVTRSNSAVALDELTLISAGDCTGGAWWPHAVTTASSIAATGLSRYLTIGRVQM